MAEARSPSNPPVRRRRRHCVVATAASRRRRRQQLSRYMPLEQSSDVFNACGLASGEYYVEKILGERVDSRTKQRFFRVRWQGYSVEHDTWEPEVNLAGVKEFVEAYRRERRARQQQRMLARQTVDTPNADNACRRRMGSWEYVPTSELVAKKTRFFDDLAEGRIDVRSDDLYSRVKCRRRQPGSVEEMVDSGNVHSVPQDQFHMCKNSPEKENIVTEEKEEMKKVKSEPTEAEMEDPPTIEKVENDVEKTPDSRNEVFSRPASLDGVDEEETLKREPVVEENSVMDVKAEASEEPEKSNSSANSEANTESIEIASNVAPEREESNGTEPERDELGGGIVRETSSDISPPELSPVTPVSPKSPISRPLSPNGTVPALEAPTLPSAKPPPVKKGTAKPVRRSRPPHTPQRRRLVQKVSPNQQSASTSHSISPSLPPPPLPPPQRTSSPTLSTAYLSLPPPPPPPCLGAPSIRPEILEKMIDDCMSQNHIPDVNPLLSYMVDDAKTPPPALVSAPHEIVMTERDLMDTYLTAVSGLEAGSGLLASQELLSSMPHLRPQTLPCPVNSGRVSNVQLRAAIMQNNFTLVRALLVASNSHAGFVSGYDLEQRDGDGESLLTRCVRHGHRHMAELLLRHGAITETARRSDGATPLMLAVDSGHLHMTRLLLEFGASPDHVNRAGETCLHRAIRRGYTALVELLLRWGVDFSRLDVHQHSALKCARSYPVASTHPEMERMLVNYLQTHNNQLTLTWTTFLAGLNFEAEAMLCPPTNFVAVAHCPHGVYRLQLQLPSSAVPLEGPHVLLLIHALPDHPSFFWLNDGPCLVESVALNGTEQRRLGHQWFISTLHPLITGALNEVEVRLAVDASTAVQYRHVRLAVVALKIRRSMTIPNLTANHVGAPTCSNVVQPESMEPMVSTANRV